MNIISRQYQELKKSLREAYLSGVSVEELRRKYQFKHARTVYFHLNPLTLKEKLRHQEARAKLLQKEVKNG